MSTKVIAVFEHRGQAEEAVNHLREDGFEREISILAKEDSQQKERGDISMKNDSIADGATTGGVLGGLTGIAAGAGALIIPGIGPLIAAGPIAGLLSGAVTGGLGGALIDFGIPEVESRQYEEDVRQGKVLVSVETTPENSEKCQVILESKGADQVKIH